MTAPSKPWHGILVATALPMRPDGRGELQPDFDEYAAHVGWLAENGCHGVVPNGSLGEYQTLSREDRARVVETAVQASPEGFVVMPGVAAYGADEARRWAEQAAEAGARCVMLLPPNSYRADPRAVVGHYREVAKAGLPVIAYNNPFDTKVDLVPDLLAELFAEGLIVAVKEFTGDPRRAYEIAELAPGLDLLVGSDDVVVELGLAGAVGWIAGYSNAFPQTSMELFELATSGDYSDLKRAMPIYRDLHPLLRWDARTEFVQAIKLSMDVVGRKGGACRPPRSALPQSIRDRIVADTEAAVAKGYR
jgi:1-pyrroline-4-hydroxy-2-carboxylate deaminase